MKVYSSEAEGRWLLGITGISTSSMFINLLIIIAIKFLYSVHTWFLYDNNVFLHFSNYILSTIKNRTQFI